MGSVSCIILSAIDTCGVPTCVAGRIISTHRGICYEKIATFCFDSDSITADGGVEYEQRAFIPDTEIVTVDYRWNS